MPIFSSKTSEIEDLVKIDQADRKALADLETRFQSLLPEWEALQSAAEQVSAQFDGTDRTYRRSVAESFWSIREQKLKDQIEAIVRERDELTAPVVAGMAEVKGRIDRRHSVICGSFNNWANAVSAALPAATAAELLTARKRLEASQDLGEIIAEADHWVERAVEASPSSVIPIITWQRIVGQLAEKGLA